MPKTKIVDSRSEKLVDFNTGVIKEQYTEESTRTIYHTEPDFIKVYLQDIIYLKNLPKSSSSTVFALLKRSTYANSEYGLTVTLCPEIRRVICQELDFKKTQSFNNQLNSLVKADILKHIGTNLYQFNPYLFGKGDWKDVSKIRATWTYTLDGRSVNAEFIKEQDEQPTEPAQDKAKRSIA